MKTDVLRKSGNFLNREIATGWVLFLAGLRLQYRMSIFGYAWTFIPMMLTGSIFIVLKSGGIIEGSGYGLSYSAYVFVGMGVWQVFVLSIQKPIQCLKKNKSMLFSVRLPVGAVFIEAFFATLFEGFVRWMVFFILLSWTGDIDYFRYVCGIWIMVGMIVFGVSIGALLAPVASVFSDIERLINVFLSALFFLTPIFYIRPKVQIASVLFKLNPVTYFLESIRNFLHSGTVSGLNTMLVMIAVAVILLPAAVKMTRHVRPIIIERS